MASGAPWLTPTPRVHPSSEASQHAVQSHGQWTGYAPPYANRSYHEGSDQSWSSEAHYDHWRRRDGRRGPRGNSASRSWREFLLQVFMQLMDAFDEAMRERERQPPQQYASRADRVAEEALAFFVSIEAELRALRARVRTLSEQEPRGYSARWEQHHGYDAPYYGPTAQVSQPRPQHQSLELSEAATWVESAAHRPPHVYGSSANMAHAAAGAPAPTPVPPLAAAAYTPSQGWWHHGWDPGYGAPSRWPTAERWHEDNHRASAARTASDAMHDTAAPPGAQNTTAQETADWKGPRPLASATSAGLVLRRGSALEHTFDLQTRRRHLNDQSPPTGQIHIGLSRGIKTRNGASRDAKQSKDVRETAKKAKDDGLQSAQDRGLSTAQEAETTKKTKNDELQLTSGPRVSTTVEGPIKASPRTRARTRRDRITMLQELMSSQVVDGKIIWSSVSTCTGRSGSKQQVGLSSGAPTEHMVSGHFR